MFSTRDQLRPRSVHDRRASKKIRSADSDTGFFRSLWKTGRVDSPKVKRDNITHHDELDSLLDTSDSELDSDSDSDDEDEGPTGVEKGMQPTTTSPQAIATAPVGTSHSMDFNTLPPPPPNYGGDVTMPYHGFGHAQLAGLVSGIAVGIFLVIALILFFIMRSPYGPAIFPCLNFGKKKRPPPYGQDNMWSKTKEADDWNPANSFADSSTKPRVPAKSDHRPPSFIRRFLGAPLSSNPLTPRYPPRAPLPDGKSLRSSISSDETLVQQPVELPAPTYQTVSTRSSQALPPVPLAELASEEAGSQSNDSASQPPPNKGRKPGVSYLSWTTTTKSSTGDQQSQPPDTARSERFSRFRRETMMTASTEDSEPPRFRTVTSWVNHQSQKVLNRPPLPPPPAPPIKDRSSVVPTAAAYNPANKTINEEGPVSPATTSMSSWTLNEQSYHQYLRGQGPQTDPSNRSEKEQAQRKGGPPAAPSSGGEAEGTHRRGVSSATTATIFRQHPGEMVDMGPSGGHKRARSSLLQTFSLG